MPFDWFFGVVGCVYDGHRDVVSGVVIALGGQKKKKENNVSVTNVRRARVSLGRRYRLVRMAEAVGRR